MRFLHTSDWQLGLTRYYLGPDAQARYTADRFDALRRLGELAGETGAAFVAVAGDVFETNRVDRRTVLSRKRVGKGASSVCAPSPPRSTPPARNG